MNDIIVNPDKNPELAKYLDQVLTSFESSYDCTRDNCGYINRELRTFLIQEGEVPELVQGLYRVDSWLGWLDENDFTEEELDLIEKRYGGSNRYSLEEYVDSLPEKEQEKYLFIPHIFLVLDDLILDAASGMFECKNSPERYFDWDENPIED
jgi:hypothetical protein